VRGSRFRLLAAVAVVLALVGAACGDDDNTPTVGSTTEGTAGGAEQATFEFVPLDAGGPNTRAALEQGDIDIALLFSSDGAIAKNDWVALKDDKKLQPVDNFVPAVRTDVVTPEVTEVLNAVSAALTVEDMQNLVASVSIDGENPADAAKAFLADVDLPDTTVDGSFVVGSANFAESEITAELYAQALESAGATVDKKLQFGARDAYIPAVESGDLDIVPEFVGSLSYFFDPAAAVSSDLDASMKIARGLAEAHGITLLEPATADSVNTFVVTQETADKYGLADVSDLAGVTDSLTLGGPPECPERPLCLKGLIDTYGVKFDV
jgi:osmoprotectant transport system substrate-binding protein